MKHNEELAIFGAEPLFSSPKPIGQLAAPNVEKYLALLKEAFDRGQLAGSGPIVETLERRLCAFHDVAHCVAVANAGLGITLLLQILARGRHGEVVMPAFGFPGLPHFARWAGQTPRFCDVEDRTHGLDPHRVAEAIGSQTTAILAANNVNGACEIEALCAVAEERGVPIVFDSVDAIASTHGGRMLGGFGRAEIFSMHATKLLNGFEGGYLTTNDAELARAYRDARDDAASVNVRLNEAHAAMALLSIDDLDAIVARNAACHRSYRSMCRQLPGLALLPFRDEATERYNYGKIVVEVSAPWPLSRDQTIEVLRAEGALAMPYFSPPLHALPVAAALATRFVQMPVGDMVDARDVERLTERLRAVIR